MSEQEKPSYEQLLELLIESRDHHDYCGYGDSWERECAVESKLPQRLNAAIEAARPPNPTSTKTQ